MKFGVVGTNFISESFVSAASKVKDVSIVAICSGRKENALKFAEVHKIPLVFNSYQEMLKSGEIDAIYLGIPNSMHYEVTMECLKHKIPTFTEKPFSSNFRQAKEMVEYAQSQQTYLHDGFVPAYTKNIQQLKKEIEKIEPLRRAVLSFGKYSSRYDSYLRKENPTTFRRELSNGSLMDLGIYSIGVAVILFGKPNRILATGTLLETGVDGLGSCLFQYDGFEVVVLHSKITDTAIQSEIQGEKGLIQMDIVSQMKTLWLQERGKDQEQVACDNTETFIYQIEDFVKNIKEGRVESKIFPHQRTLDILEVLDECRKQMGVQYPADEVD